MTEEFLQLIAKLTNPMTQFDDIVQTITSDPQLSNQILKLVNAPSVGVGRDINSLSLAIALTGLSQIRNWAIFVLLSGVEEKPRELCTLSLTRAKCCELLAVRIYNRALSETAFTAGLLSTLDALLNQSTEQLVSKLNFAEQVKSALLHQTGKVGKILHLTLLHEQGRWANIDWEVPDDDRVTQEELTDIYASAVNWAQPILEVS